jgi:hypothetical protein
MPVEHGTALEILWVLSGDGRNLPGKEISGNQKNFGLRGGFPKPRGITPGRKRGLEGGIRLDGRGGNTPAARRKLLEMILLRICLEQRAPKDAPDFSSSYSKYV